MNQNWKVLSASSTGTSHVERQIECQDRIEHAILSTDIGTILIVAASDGAGSSEHSQLGASLACNMFVKEVETNLVENNGAAGLNREFGDLWLTYFRGQASDLANESNLEIRDLACTFLGAVLWENGGAFYQVGDGAIVCSPDGEADSYYFAVPPKRQVYANETDFITDESANINLRFEYSEECINRLMIFTDGIEKVAVDAVKGVPFEPFVGPLFGELEKTDDLDALHDKFVAFLESPRINEKTDDDKTVFAAIRQAP